MNEILDPLRNGVVQLSTFPCRGVESLDDSMPLCHPQSLFSQNGNDRAKSQNIRERFLFLKLKYAFRRGAVGLPDEQTIDTLSV